MASDPSERLWIPLRAPSAPLHVWALTAALPLAPDPVTAGRLVSAAAGILLVPAFAWLVWAAGRAFGQPSPAAAIIAAALAALSPFFVFASRLARVDALFVLEVAIATTLAIELARRPSPGAAVAFGVAMGVTMLTRQAVSYPLWLLPPLASLLKGDRFIFQGERGLENEPVPFFGAFVVAVVVGGGLWVPMLLAPGWPDLATRIFHLGPTRPELGLDERLFLLARNLRGSARAFATYLTPAVFVAGLGALGVVWVQQKRLFAFLAGCLAILLLPAALFAAEFFPRYALPAALPLLAATAFALASIEKRSARVLVNAALLLWPAIDTTRGLASWHSWRLLPVDRRQFVSGWTAGLATQRASAWLRERTQEGPIAVVVPNVSGHPADGVWLVLEGERNVSLAYSQDFLTKPATEARGDLWIDGPPVTPPSDHPVYFVSPDPAFLGARGWAPARDVVLPLNPRARLVARFENLPDENGRVESAVEVYRLR